MLVADSQFAGTIIEQYVIGYSVPKEDKPNKCMNPGKVASRRLLDPCNLKSKTRRLVFLSESPQFHLILHRGSMQNIRY